MKEKRQMIGAFNLSLKYWILIGICLQNAGYTLLRKYSTKYEDVSSREILLISEIIKLIISTWMTLHDVSQAEKAHMSPSPSMENNSAVTSARQSNIRSKGISRLSWLVWNSSKMLVLAGIYAAMNILSFVALQFIGAGEFTICAQLKILSTAGFSVLILGTSLTWTKWRALMLLVFGCILVASPTFTSAPPSNGTTAADASISEGVALQLFGFGAVLTEVVLSGFASIYFEKVVKNHTEPVTIWERNYQLGLYSILMYTCIIIYDNFNTTANLATGGAVTAIPRSAFANWTWITLTVSVLGACGGLLVAATLKYADSILKTIATAGAILLSTVLGHYFLSGPLNLIVSLGGGVVVIAICNYTFDSTST